MISVLSVGVFLLGFGVQAQDGNAGINEANNKVRSYFDAGTNLVYAVGALLGLIGAVKVYQKWNAGDHDTGKVAAAWFGSCVFLVVVATVIRSEVVVSTSAPIRRAMKKPSAITNELSIAETSLQALMRHQNQRRR